MLIYPRFFNKNDKTNAMKKKLCDNL
jgi:hypothetical protein